MKRALLLVALLLGSAQGAGIKFRPQGEALVQAVQAAVAQLSTKDVPMTLDATSGPTMTVGGVGVSAAPFNPDAIYRVVMVGSERRIELNPHGPVPLAEAVKQTLMTELKLKEWTPTAAQQRFGGADLNGDGVIDLADLAIIMANFGTNTGAAGDLNQDRKVDDADLRIFSAQYSKAITAPAPAPAATPAPSTPAPTTPTPATPATSTPAAPATTTPENTTPANTTPTSPANTTPGTGTDSTKSPPALPDQPATNPNPQTPASPAPTPTKP